jgi:OOP family OmpA-OmpF porin/outer membrane immunogenic protein
MKNTVFAIALSVASLAAIPVLGHAADDGNDGFFVNGNVGQSNLSKGAYDNSDTGYGANIGYRWALNPSVALGVEGGYTNLGSIDAKPPFAASGVGRAEIDGWNVGVNGHFNINPNWYLSGRAGLFRSNLKGGYLDASGAAVNIDDTSDKYYAGAGFGYDFSNNLSVGLNYDYYKVNKNGLNLSPDLVSVSAEYRFR